MLEEIIELIKAHSNDAELGKRIREWYWNNKRKSQIDVWYEREHMD